MTIYNVSSCKTSQSGCNRNCIARFHWNLTKRTWLEVERSGSEQNSRGMGLERALEVRNRLSY